MASTSTWTSKLGNKYPMAQIQQNDVAAQKELQRLRSLKCNSTCADCGRRDNSWASISHGVFICVVCSDVHRSVGTHISKVKGCTGTYLWGPDELEKMQTTGNLMGENIYGPEKVDPCASKEQKQRYVTGKYEKRSIAVAKQGSATSEAELVLAKATDRAPAVQRAEPSQPKVQSRNAVAPIARKAIIPDSLFDDLFNVSEDNYSAESLKSTNVRVVQPALQKCANAVDDLDDFLNSTLCASAQTKAATVAAYPSGLAPCCKPQTALAKDCFEDWPF